jgi:hypothetical protein
VSSQFSDQYKKRNHADAYLCLRLARFRAICGVSVHMERKSGSGNLLRLVKKNLASYTRICLTGARLRRLWRVIIAGFTAIQGIVLGVFLTIVTFLRVHWHS